MRGAGSQLATSFVVRSHVKRLSGCAAEAEGVVLHLLRNRLRAVTKSIAAVPISILARRSSGTGHRRDVDGRR